MSLAGDAPSSSSQVVSSSQQHAVILSEQQVFPAHTRRFRMQARTDAVWEARCRQVEIPIKDFMQKPERLRRANKLMTAPSASQTDAAERKASMVPPNHQRRSISFKESTQTNDPIGSAGSNFIYSNR